MTDQRNILITGCSSGIGRCVAEGLHERGYRVFATARKQEDVRQLSKQGLESMQLDLSSTDSIRSAVYQVLEQTNGTLYGLFNNGAYGQPGAVEDLDRKSLRDLFEVNLFGTQELTNLVIPVMRKQGYGRIVQNSSVLGFVTLKYRGAYNASKFALEALTDTMRLELKGSGIHISLIEPGPIESSFRKNAYAAYLRNINPDSSHFRDIYLAMEAAMHGKEPVMPFTLGPEAVLKKVVHALESKRPRIRYYVTFPTYLFGYLKRILPAGWMDFILEKI